MHPPSRCASCAGLCDVSKRSCLNLLRRGKSVAIAVGGGTEVGGLGWGRAGWMREVKCSAILCVYSASCHQPFHPAMSIPATPTEPVRRPRQARLGAEPAQGVCQDCAAHRRLPGAGVQLWREQHLQVGLCRVVVAALSLRLCLLAALSLLAPHELVAAAADSTRQSAQMSQRRGVPSSLSSVAGPPTSCRQTRASARCSAA